MDKTTVMAEFVIWGDKFDPQTITNSLKIAPTRCWTKEIDERPADPPPPNPENLVRIKDPELKTLFNEIYEKRGTSREKRVPRKHDFSYWEIDTGYQESSSIGIQINQIYQILKNKINVLKELNNKNTLTYRLEIVINVEDNEKPGMFFDNYIIDFLHEIGGTIDIDMYIYS